MDERRERIVSAVETGVILFSFVPLWVWMFVWRGERGHWLLCATVVVLVAISVRRIRRFLALRRTRPPEEGGP